MFELITRRNISFEDLFEEFSKYRESYRERPQIVLDFLTTNHIFTDIFIFITDNRYSLRHPGVRTLIKKYKEEVNLNIKYVVYWLDYGLIKTKFEDGLMLVRGFDDYLLTFVI